jgi:hypothetical protein
MKTPKKPTVLSVNVLPLDARDSKDALPRTQEEVESVLQWLLEHRLIRIIGWDPSGEPRYDVRRRADGSPQIAARLPGSGFNSSE